MLEGVTKLNWLVLVLVERTVLWMKQTIGSAIFLSKKHLKKILLSEEFPKKGIFKTIKVPSSKRNTRLAI
jgi:hypothetical protein